MSYLILLVLGLLFGAVFLAVLLAGDRKEARLKTQQKASQEQRTQAGQSVDEAWPPPPSASAQIGLSPPVPSPQTVPTRTASRKMVRTFSLVRNYALGITLLAYILYSCFPQFNFGWMLLATALATAALWSVVMALRRRARSSSVSSQEHG